MMGESGVGLGSESWYWLSIVYSWWRKTGDWLELGMEVLPFVGVVCVIGCGDYVQYYFSGAFGG